MILKRMYITEKKKICEKALQVKVQWHHLLVQRELQLKTPPGQVRIHPERRSNRKYDAAFDVAYFGEEGTSKGLF